MSLLNEIKEAGSLLSSGSVPAGLPASSLGWEQVAFAHAVNSRSKLAAALVDRSVTVLEADVILDASDGKTPVMGHDPGSAHDFTFSAFVEAAAHAGKGIKVDIKQHGAVDGTLAILTELENEAHRGGVPHWPLLRLDRPGGKQGEFVCRPLLFINADVLSGTGACNFNAASSPLDREEQIEEAKSFVQRVWAALPSSILSLGWSTFGEGGVYTHAMVDGMLAVVGDEAACGAPITFPVRASYVVASWPQLQRLLAAGAFTSLTVWSNAPLSAVEEAWIRANLPADRTLYDLPAPQPRLRAASDSARHGSPVAAGPGAIASALGLAQDHHVGFIVGAGAAAAAIAAFVAWRTVR